MDVYVFNAALLCEDCAFHYIEAHLDDEYLPQGPYADGGGEADCPNHCDHCGTFLENPLTSEGVDYVKAAVDECYGSKNPRGSSEVVAEWQEFYNITPDIWHEDDTLTVDAIWEE